MLNRRFLPESTLAHNIEGERFAPLNFTQLWKNILEHRTFVSLDGLWSLIFQFLKPASKEGLAALTFQEAESEVGCEALSCSLDA